MKYNRIVYQDKQFTTEPVTEYQIVSGNCYRARSLLSSALEIDTFEFEVHSRDTGLRDFAVDAPLALYHGDTRIGTFFVQEVKRVSAYQYAFCCISAAGLLDKRDHYGGVYTGQTVETVVRAICGGMPVTVADNVKKIKLYGWLPIAKARDNLAQVLFATSATAKEDANGALIVQGLADDTKSTLDAHSVFEGGSVAYGSPAAQVVVLEHQYIQGQETQDLFAGTASDGDRIPFDEPMHSVSASGFAIKARGDNYAVLSAGSGTLTGKKYIHTTREVVGRRDGRAAQAGGTVRVEQATLISLANSRAVADRLAAYYAHAERITADILYTGQQAGDVVNIAHPYDGGMVQACLESVDITLSGRARAAVTALVGYLPPDISQIEYYDTFEVLTGAGTWVPPEKIRNLRAVLIGGSQGGASGLPGQNASASTGGAGGAGGAGGSGGKIFQTEISLARAQSFAYRCGSPGAGGTYGNTSSPGTFGTDTTFGPHSSAGGSASDSGFLNPINNKIYGKKGERGRNGGRGGDGGKGTYGDHTPSQDGEAVASYPGGTRGDDSSSSMHQQFAGGSGGSGAAYGQNGSPGNRAYTNTAYSEGGNGVNGANASPPTAVPQDGNGGYGGNGGGGGSGGGEAYVGRVDSEGYPKAKKGTPGLGGAGSSGGMGSAGCIILFYSAPVKAV